MNNSQELQRLNFQNDERNNVSPSAPPRHASNLKQSIYDEKQPSQKVNFKFFLNYLAST